MLDPTDRPMTPKELAELRDRLSHMSVTALLDAYHSAWYGCKIEGREAPNAARIQKLVQVWKELKGVRR